MRLGLRNGANADDWPETGYGADVMMCIGLGMGMWLELGLEL